MRFSRPSCSGVPVPGADDVHVVRVRAADCRARIGRMARLLGREEVAAASRFLFAEDRVEYVVAHAALRSVLGSWLGEAPERLVFRRGPGGKPELAEPFVASGLKFNLSASEGTALIAIALDCEVGVDIEARASFPGYPRVACRVFSDAERAHLASRPESARLDAFFTLWTLREASLKARGRSVFSELTPDDRRELSTCSLLAGAGFAAALAVVGSRPRLHCWDWMI